MLCSFVIAKICVDLRQVSISTVIDIYNCFPDCIIFIGICMQAIAQRIENILMTGIAVSFILLKIHPLNIDGKVKAFIKLCWAFEIDAVTPICFDVVLIPRSIVVSPGNLWPLTGKIMRKWAEKDSSVSPPGTMIWTDWPAAWIRKR